MVQEAWGEVTAPPVSAARAGETLSRSLWETASAVTVAVAE